MARNDEEDDDLEGECASPPCLMHLVDLPSGDLASPIDRRQWADVKRWRKAERERMIALRLAISVQDRRRYSQRIASSLDRLVDDVSGRVVAVYWPFRGEPDLLPWIESLHARGA